MTGRLFCDIVIETHCHYDCFCFGLKNMFAPALGLKFYICTFIIIIII